MIDLDWLNEVLRPIREAILDLRRLMPSVRPATVTGVSPLRIQFDNEDAPVSASPTTLVPVGPGDRVRVLHYGNTHLILGRVNTKGIPYRMASGSVTVNITDSTSGFAEFSLHNRFTVVPRLFASIDSETAQYTIAGCRAFEPNRGRVAVRRIPSNDTTVSLTVRWWAVQMTPTSAEG